MTEIQLGKHLIYDKAYSSDLMGKKCETNGFLWKLITINAI